ncbi:pyruvate decarboxylase [Lasius niger]|uniref:Pyruvate decarboxylase n=1 Tax=Lasius niger TaxID=67767 RepID=A0A0J7KZX9_LASNI|nr:pyruvate decarboxylase [Lasius niger]
MYGDANQGRTGDYNQTAGQGLRNVTDGLYEALLDHINVTSQPDINVTEEIDSFYFYEDFCFKQNRSCP